jgi:hypothetical protein
MYQYEAVIKVMEENGGFATLGYLYQNALTVKGCEWGTKTPYASIRRIVQDNRFFFKIKPGLWALKSHKDRVLLFLGISEQYTDIEKTNFDHTYYQGLLVEIGNYKGYETFIPHQDKNKLYLLTPLKKCATLQEYYSFTYENVIKRAITIDVTWFNKRKYPTAFLEVEHTTDMQNSLIKFIELQDFYADFYIVSSENRHQEYLDKTQYNAFKEISKRVKFVNYTYVSQLHAKSAEFYHYKVEGVL